MATRLLRASAVIFVACGSSLGAVFAAEPSTAPKSVAAQTPPASQRELAAKELQTLAEQAPQLAVKGKLAAAIASGEKALRLGRELDGNASPTAAAWQEWLAPLYEYREDWQAGRRAREELLAIRSKLYGKNDWRATDARLALRDADVRAHLTPQQRRQLAEAEQAMTQVSKLDQKGDAAKAIPLAAHAIEIRQRVLGDDHPQTAVGCVWLGYLYANVGKYAEGEPWHRRALAIREKSLGAEHPDTAASKNLLAELYRSQKDDAKAEPLFRQAMVVRKKVLGEAHPDYLISLNNLAGLYESREDYAKAEPLYREALGIRKKILGEAHPDYVTSLNNLAGIYNSQEQFAKAEPLYREALGIRKKILGEAHPDYVTSLNNLAGIYESQKQYAKAEALYRQALEIRKKTLAELHPDYLMSLDNLAGLYDSQGDLAKAEALYHQVLALTKRVLGEAHADYVMSLDNLADFYLSHGQYAKAEPFYRQALEIQKKVLGEAHQDYATSLDDLAVLYSFQGNYAKAEPLYRQALEIRKKALGEAHPAYAESLNNLAALYEAEGNFAKAEPLFQQALEIRTKALGNANPDYALSVNRLAKLYMSMGDYAKAKPLFLQALEILKQTLGDADLDYAQTLNNLALLYQSQEEYAKAEPLFRQAIEIVKTASEEANPDYAIFLSNLAMLYLEQGDYAKAEPLCRRALGIRKELLGEAHTDYALSLNNLALLYVHQGNYAKAEPLLWQALGINKKAVGEAHPHYATGLQNLAVLFDRRGDSAKAAPLYRQALECYEKHFANTLQIQSERQQLAFAESLRGNLDAYLSVTAEKDENPLDAYRHVLVWKGAIFERQLSRRALRERTDLRRQFDELAFADVRLATSALRGPGRKPRAVWERQVAELSDRKESLERKLSAASAEFLDRQSIRNLKPEELQHVIPQNVALVDVLEYRHSRPSLQNPGQWAREERLAAFVVRPDRPIVRIELGSIKPLAEAIAAWRTAIEHDRGTAEELEPKATDAAHKAPQQTLKEAIWDPLRKPLEGAEIVLISPDGVLNQVPLTALPGQQPGRYLVEETKLAILPVPRLLPMLLRPEERAKAKDDSLLIVGDVSYGGSPGKAEGMQVATRSAVRGARSGGLQFAELDYSRSEMATIRDSFEKNFSDGKATALRGNNATETAFRREAPKYRWLHLATHGFFAPPQIASVLAAPKDDKERGLGEFGGQGLSGYHPGLLSGLALSGANTPAGADDDDGILTAVEVAGLDLERADLVVLSACETGLGAVAGGEGVLGLQRAFQLSGAKTTVASLWKVPDRATMQLMQRFYENLWDKKLSKLDALREAQLWMLKEGRPRGFDLDDAAAKKPTSTRLAPRYWAAFALSGDWR